MVMRDDYRRIQKSNEKRNRKEGNAMKIAGKRQQKKGFIYTLEVLLAVGLIFLTLVYLFRFSEPTPQHDLTIIKRSGMEALEFMDQYHELRKWVSEFNEAKIESTLNTLLPNNIKFESEICAAECSAAGVNTKKSVVAVDYYVSAYRDQHLGRKIRLWLWK